VSEAPSSPLIAGSGPQHTTVLGKFLLIRIQVSALQFLKTDHVRSLSPDRFDVQLRSIDPGINPVAFVKRTPDVESQYSEQARLHPRPPR
jgi:hypothetical protein